jgi:HEAT repeat protein
MEWLALGKVATSAIAWRAFGLNAAGRTLIDALASRDENVRVIAGMSLVKGGARALPLLRDALKRRSTLSMVISIIGSIGDKSVVGDIEPFLNDGDVQVQKAARAVHELLRSR